MPKRKRGACRPGTHPAKRASAKMTLRQREERVKTAMQHGHDKEAIVHLKQMLKQERRPQWEAWMLEAHQRQTHRLLQAGKFRQSARLFESGQRLCGLSLDCADYIQCLLQLEQTSAAAERYVLAQSSLCRADLFKLQVKLGAIALAGDRSVLQRLPANDPVLIDFDKALALLETWCANDAAGLRQALKTLSFRSPYRDLRTLLSASLTDDGTKGAEDRERLARIPAASPYRRLAMLIQIASLDNQQILSSLAGLNAEEKRFLMPLRGWSKEQGKLAEKLAGLPEDPEYTSVFRFADSHKTVAVTSLQGMARMAAIHGSAQHNRAVNLSRFEKRFGRLNETGKAHAEALGLSFAYAHGLLDDNGHELGDFKQVEEAWLNYVEALHEADTGEDVPFRIALISRYINDLWIETGNPVNEVTARNLERSLQVDPRDQPTHLLLIEYFLQGNKPKKARMAVDRALQVYPEDISILLAAIEVAVAGNTFKKAAAYAKQILNVDPINREARRLLHNAHLSHARKQASAGKWHLVHKELKQATRWADDPGARASGLILEACCELRAKQTKAAADLLNEASVLAGSAMNTCFIIHYEADNIGFHELDIYSQAKINWPPDPLQHKDELFSLIDTVDYFLNEDNTDQIALVLSRFNTTLEQALNLIEDENEFEKLCEFWLRTRQDSLLACYADVADRQFEDRPIFTYFRMLNKPWLEPDDYQALEEAMDEAREQGNQALAVRILSLLARLAPPPLHDMDTFREIMGMTGEDDNPIGVVASHDHHEIVNLIRTADMDEVLINMESMVGIPRAEIEQVRAIIGDEALREFFLHAFNGGSVASLEDLIPKDNRLPKGRSKKKKASEKSTHTRQLGLFE